MVMQIQETSSDTKERKKRTEVLIAAKQRKIDVIVVWKLDLWGRSLVELINELQDLTAFKFIRSIKKRYPF